MDEAFARAIASVRHAGQLDRSGRPIIDHLRRVAQAVPPSVRNVAWLHDLRERTGIRPAELRFAGLTAVEAAALDLLTHARGEDYERYIWRIARARGPAGVLARQVKLADLEDHLAAPHAAFGSSPPYAWARRKLLAGSDGAARPARASTRAGHRVS